VLGRPDTVLEMAQEQDLIYDKVHEQVQSFAGGSQTADIELHNRFDVIMRPLTITSSRIGFPE